MVFHGVGNTRITEKHAKAIADYLENDPNVPLEHLPVRLGEAVPFSAPTLKKAMQKYRKTYPVFGAYLENHQARRFGPKPKLTPELAGEIRKQFKEKPTPENFQRLCLQHSQISRDKMLDCVVENAGTRNDQMRLRTALKYYKKD